MNNESSKPNAEQYARVLLWHICNLQSALQLLQADFIRKNGQENGFTDLEILQATSNHAKQVRKLAESLYRDALQQANIKQSPDYPHAAPQ